MDTTCWHMNATLEGANLDPDANCAYEHSFRFSKGKLKTMIFFSETTATCDLKVGRCRQIIEQMKVFTMTLIILTLAQGPLHMKI